MVRSTVLRRGVSALGLAVLSMTGAAQADPGSLFGANISEELAQQHLESASIDRKVEVFVRLQQASVAEFYAAQLEAGNQAPDTSTQRALAKRISAQHQALIRDLEALGGDVQGSLRVSANGVLVTLPLGEIANAASLPNVRKVSKVDTHIPSNHFNSVPWIGAPEVWASLGDGDGVSIGIIDTGIDYYHANFGGSGSIEEFESDNTAIVEEGTFPTAKVVGGWDFVGDDYTGGNTPMPDADPLDCNGHGTHVGGSAAGLGVGDVIGPGVAKGAQLYALRVFGCDGSTRVTSQAIEWSMDPNGDGDMSDHLDVINMSLGASNGYADDPTAIASDNAAKVGVVVVASAGNSGDAPFITGAPGVSKETISVAALASGGDVDALEISGDIEGRTEYIEGTSPVLVADGSVSAAVAIPSANPATSVRDGCDPFTDDMTGKVALISRGACSFATKAENAVARGAVALVVYNDGSSADRIAPIVMAGLEGSNIPGVMIASTSGQSVTEAVAGGSNAVITLDASLTTPTMFGDTIASFSSRGPGSSGTGFKPDLGSSGVNIVSAGVGTGSGPLTLSGTSMSAPHVAGAAALLLQEYGKLAPRLIKSILQNSTRDSNPLNALAAPFPLSRGGVGVVDVSSAVAQTAVAAPGGVSFGRVDRSRNTALRERVRVQALKGGARSFDVTHVPNQTMTGVSVDCGGPVAVKGQGYANRALTNITLRTDVSEMPVDFGGKSLSEVDGWCVFSDGEETMRVGYLAVIDPASRIYVAATGGGDLRVVNSGEAAGFAHLFTQVGGQGDQLNGAINAIDAVGFRTTDPADFFGFPVMQIGLATELPWESLTSVEIQIDIDSDFDGVPEAQLLVVDQGLFQNPARLTGDLVTIQFDLVNGGGFFDWNVTNTDFNDRVGFFNFTRAPVGLVPDRFAYNMTTIGRDGRIDTQSGVVDTAAEVVPDVADFGLIPNSRVTMGVTGAGDILALLKSNPAPAQKGTATFR